MDYLGLLLSHRVLFSLWQLCRIPSLRVPVPKNLTQLRILIPKGVQSNIPCIGFLINLWSDESNISQDSQYKTHPCLVTSTQFELIHCWRVQRMWDKAFIRLFDVYVLILQMRDCGIMNRLAVLMRFSAYTTDQQFSWTTTQRRVFNYDICVEHEVNPGWTDIYAVVHEVGT